MPNLNTVSFGGHAGRDAESITTKTGKELTTVSVAVKSGWGDNESTLWVTIKVFGKFGSYISHAKKGDYVQVVGGELSQDSWEKDGETRTSLSVNAGIGAALLTIQKGTYNRKETPSQATHEPTARRQAKQQDIDGIPSTYDDVLPF